MEYVVLGFDECPWCLKVEAYLMEQGLSVEYHDIYEEPHYLELCKLSGLRTFPQVFAPDGKLIGGYEDTVKYLGH